jgi:uncharacterized membrane protein
MYLVLKLVHVTAVVLFLGNIITGLFWHSHAARTRDPRLLFHAMDGIIRSDRWFTVPGVIVITASGILAAIRAHLPIFGTPWILGAIVLFSLSGVLFGVRVAPLQKKLRAIAHAGVTSEHFDMAGYQRVAKSWELWGAAALLLPLGSLALMVMKPAF